MHGFDKREWRRRCKPTQILFRSEPGALIRCPKCQQVFHGIPYHHGRDLFTLPEHLPNLEVRERMERGFIAVQRAAGDSES